MGSAVHTDDDDDDDDDERNRHRQPADIFVFHIGRQLHGEPPGQAAGLDLPTIPMMRMIWAANKADV